MKTAVTWRQAGVFYTADIVNILGSGGLLLAFFRFPDGRSLGGLWRLGERLLLAGIALGAVGTILTPSLDQEIAGHTIAVPNPFIAGGAGDLFSRYDVAGLLILIPSILGMGSVVARYRRGSETTRLQLRWVLYPLLAGVLLQGLIGLSDALLGTSLGTGLASIGVGIVFTVGIPAGILMAITRSRLYEIDRILSRTVSWATLTGVLVGIYSIGVLGVGALLPGEPSDLLIAASTLVVAALFRPLQSRIQGLVDGQFNRSRHDAKRIVEGFSGRLRDEIDLGALRTDLLHTARTSLEPTSAHLWLAP